MSTIWCPGGLDSSQVLWPIMWVIDSKPHRIVVEYSRVQNSFCFCGLDHSHWVICLGMSLLSPMALGLEPHWGFTIFYLDPKVSMKALVSVNRCQIIFGWRRRVEYIPRMSYWATLLTSLFEFYSLWDLKMDGT